MKPLDQGGTSVTMKNEHVLDVFLNPESVAVFGSMIEDWFFGAGVVVKELIDLGYSGTIYPVHPTAKTVCSRRVYNDIVDIDGPIDLAVIITSYKHVPGIIKKCAQKGVRAAVVVADNFGESGTEGENRQEELTQLARSFGIRLIGPNTLGVFNVGRPFTTIPYEKGYTKVEKGPFSIITQTGMYGPQAIALNEYPFGVSKIIDLGNMCDIDEVDCLEYLGEDQETRIISLYIEHTRRPADFLKTVKKISREKPILCLKGGKSPESADAMASHTGSMAGDDQLYEALFKQSGVIRVSEYEDLLECAKAFISQPLPGGNRLGVISITGAMGIACIDAAASEGLCLGDLSPASRKRLSAIDSTLRGHPIDLGPASAADGLKLFSYYTKCFDILMEDENIDCIYVNTYISSYFKADNYKEVLQHMSKRNSKPVVVWSYGPSSRSVRELASLVESYGIPHYTTTHKAIRALGYMAAYAGWRNLRE